MDPFSMMLVSTLLNAGVGAASNHFFGQKPPQPSAQMPQPQPSQGGMMAQQQAASMGGMQQINPAMQLLMQIIQQGRNFG